MLRCLSVAIVQTLVVSETANESYFPFVTLMEGSTSFLAFLRARSAVETMNGITGHARVMLMNDFETEISSRKAVMRSEILVQE